MLVIKYRYWGSTVDDFQNAIISDKEKRKIDCYLDDEKIGIWSISGDFMFRIDESDAVNNGGSLTIWKVENGKFVLLRIFSLENVYSVWQDGEKIYINKYGYDWGDVSDDSGIMLRNKWEEYWEDM